MKNNEIYVKNGEATIGNNDTYLTGLLESTSYSYEIGFDFKNGSYVKEFIEQPKIDKVIFNNPATIIFWKDGTKTIVKAQNGETFDKEKGMAMAISKKIFGNKNNFNNIFKEYCGE